MMSTGITDWQEEVKALQAEIKGYLIEVAEITSALNAITSENHRIKREIEALQVELSKERLNHAMR